MKKKVLPQFHHSYSTNELSLIASIKSYFVELKQQKLTVVPFGFSAKKDHAPERIGISEGTNNSQLNFIERLVKEGEQLVKNKYATCFAIAYDAYVFDEDSIDEDALAILMFMEDADKIQINVPYVVSDDDLVFGEEWIINPAS